MLVHIMSKSFTEGSKALINIVEQCGEEVDKVQTLGGESLHVVSGKAG